MTKKNNHKKRRGTDKLKALAVFLGQGPKKDAARADAQVAKLLSTLMAVGPDLPSAPPMTEAERGRHLALLCPHAGSVVARTAKALLRHPQHFPEFPGVGADLNERQKRCDRLWLLEIFLFQAAQRCREAQRIEQGQLLKSALDVAEHVEHAAALRLPQLDHQWRQILLGIATRPVRKHRARSTKQRLATVARKAQRDPSAAPRG